VEPRSSATPGAGFWHGGRVDGGGGNWGVKVLDYH
jgi:hypothetical protein